MDVLVAVLKNTKALLDGDDDTLLVVRNAACQALSMIGPDAAKLQIVAATANIPNDILATKDGLDSEAASKLTNGMIRFSSRSLPPASCSHTTSG